MRRLSTAVGAAALALAAAAAALAAFVSSATASQTLSTATLAAPTAAAAANGACVVNKSLTVQVTWTATTSSFADGYEILRATAAGGPYASLGTVSGRTTTTYNDATAAFATTYYYEVKATAGNWRSVPTAAASVLTLTRLCK